MNRRDFLTTTGAAALGVAGSHLLTDAPTAALANGMPTTRQAFVPQPLVGQSVEALRGYVEGMDPISKRPFVEEVIQGLTRPLDEEDLKGATFERATPRLLEPDTRKNLHELFLRCRDGATGARYVQLRASSLDASAASGSA